MKFIVLLSVFLIIIFLDKGITMVNITQANKNFPEAMADDKYKIEKNPVAKWFFEKFGLVGGTIIYSIVTLATLFLAFFLLSLAMQPRVSLYVIMVAYGFVIANNFYFLLKYSGLIL